jgi:predicted DNA-binding protein (UPF0251 family)
MPGSSKRPGRPKKRKIVQEGPRVDVFIPGGRPGVLDEVFLDVDEYEALRLSDFLGSDQKTAAQSMGIAQQSFSRVIRIARKKIADAIVNGKMLKITGGPYISQRSQSVIEKLRRKK